MTGNDLKWHISKNERQFSISLKRKLFQNIFVKLNKKAARKLQKCIWYLRYALQSQQALVLGQFMQNSKNSMSFILYLTKLDILNFIVTRTRKSLKSSKYLQRNSKNMIKILSSNSKSHDYYNSIHIRNYNFQTQRNSNMIKCERALSSITKYVIGKGRFIVNIPMLL